MHHLYLQFPYSLPRPANLNELDSAQNLAEFIGQNPQHKDVLLEQINQFADWLSLNNRFITSETPNFQFYCTIKDAGVVLFISNCQIQSYDNKNWLSRHRLRRQNKKLLKHLAFTLANKIDISEKNIFQWDQFSDQPHVIRAPQFKKRVRSYFWPQHLLMLVTSLLILPLAIMVMPIFKGRQRQRPIDCVGIGVNLDKGEQQQELIEELGAKHLIMRVYMRDIENLDAYVKFAESFNLNNKKTFLIVIIQDREHIENLQLSKDIFAQIFSAFSHLTEEFQIGTTINRLKWGFYCVEEYLHFYHAAQQVRDAKFTQIKLLGPSVIDFEYYYNARAMFNAVPIKYDKTAALLYVDRRGAPSNKQYLFFDTKNKIRLLNALVRLSPKSSSKEIYLTEANWPIKGTAPYSPTSEFECVELDDYCKHMLEYIETACSTGMVNRVYWHQLIAPGYGLVDNRDGKLVKYPQFAALKQLLTNQPTDQELS